MQPASHRVYPGGLQNPPKRDVFQPARKNCHAHNNVGLFTVLDSRFGKELGPRITGMTLIFEELSRQLKNDLQPFFLYQAQQFQRSTPRMLCPTLQLADLSSGQVKATGQDGLADTFTFP